jgi:hypothetical protein
LLSQHNHGCRDGGASLRYDNPLFPLGFNLARLAPVNVAHRRQQPGDGTVHQSPCFGPCTAKPTDSPTRHLLAQYAPNGAHLFTDKGRGVNALVTGVQREPEEILLTALRDVDAVLQQIKADLHDGSVNPVLLQLLATGATGWGVSAGCG